jgi:hypothetical protein
VLDKLSEIGISSIQTIYNEMPHEWLSKNERKIIIKWWSSKDRVNRIELVRGGLKNGSLL